MTKRRLATCAIAPLLLCTACFTTHFNLVAPSDALHALVVSGAAPDGWKMPEFDDGEWLAVAAGGSIGPLLPDAAGAMPTVCVRRAFDLGPEAASFHTLTLSVATQAPWTAYLNGAEVASGGAHAAPSTIHVPAGLLGGSGNLLAIELHPAPGTTQLAIQPLLDGHPDPAAPGAPRIVRGPWLTSPSPTGATIVWESDSAAPARAIVDGRSYDGGSGTHHQALIADLEPARSYRYHVEVGPPEKAQSSEEGRLATSPEPGERVRFVVYGDNRTDGDAHRRVVQAIENEGADFLVNTGDLVGTNSDSEWQSFFDIEYSLLRDVPLFPTVGNHEASTAGGEPHMAELFPEAGAQSLGGGRVYGADYGDVHVAVVDSNGDLHQQAPWLEADLSSAEARGARHLFVVMHWGPFSSGAQVMHGSNEDAREAIVPICRAHRVDAIFEGHDHFYERGRSGELTYFVTGGGGAPLVSPGRIAETITAEAIHHYLVVDVAGPNATVTAKDSSGAPFDSVVLTR